jgi:hypothetical protein
MRVTEANHPRNYLDDEIIMDMARRMLFEVAGERPGADLMEAPRTVLLSLAFVGITVAALAEANAGTGGKRTARSPQGRHHRLCADAVRVRADHRRPAPERVGNPAEILFPPALLRRAARYISGAANLGCERRQTPGRDSRDGTQPAGRDLAPGR